MPIKKYTVATILLILTVAAAYYLTKVKIVDLSSQGCIDEKSLNLVGKNIFTISEKSQEGELKSKYTCLDDVKLIKIYPSTIKIEVTSTVAAVQVASSNLFITPEGKVIKSQAQNLPILYLAEKDSLQEGQNISNQTALFTVKLAQLLSKSDFHATNIRIISPLEIAFYNQREAVALFTSEKTAESQVDSLQQVLAKTKIDHENIKKIDLRFERPTISYN